MPRLLYAYQTLKNETMCGSYYLNNETPSRAHVNTISSRLGSSRGNPRFDESHVLNLTNIVDIPPCIKANESLKTEKLFSI